MTKATKLTRFWRPRWWKTWLALGAMAAAAYLPFNIQLFLGRSLGKIICRHAERRRKIVEINLQLCFPEVSAKKREELLRRHFDNLGIGLIEIGMCWWTPAFRLRKLTEIEGLSHLENALQRGKGVLLLTAHFTTLEIGARLLALFHPVVAVYREHENALLNAVMTRRRGARSAGIIKRGDIRGLLKSLKAGQAIWYAPDQAYLGPRSALVPFFGIPAPTNTGTARLARRSDAAVLPFFVERLPGTQGYRLRIQPALKNFPGESSDFLATQRVNEILETGIRQCPAQYLWSHDRFKKVLRD